MAKLEQKYSLVEMLAALRADEVQVTESMLRRVLEKLDIEPEQNELDRRRLQYTQEDFIAVKEYILQHS